MKTIILLLSLFISTSIFGQSYPFAVHPECDKSLESEALKQCSEEKIIAAIHERIRYKHYENKQFSIAEIEFDINDQGSIELIAINIINGVDVKADIESALKHLSYQTVFKPAEEEGITFYDNKKLVIKFTEASFMDTEDIRKEEELAKEKEQALAKKYIESYPKKENASTDRVEEIYKVVEQMPRFFSSECEELGVDNKAKKACADKKMLEFVYSRIKYPAIARVNGVEGTVVIQFTVDTDGTIEQARLIRDIGAQCGAEALRVVNLMNDFESWIPGMQRGKRVKVQFNLPIKFRLEKNRTERN